MAKRIQISFAEKEKELYEYLKTKRSFSVYIKDLIEEDMKEENKDNNGGNLDARL